MIFDSYTITLIYISIKFLQIFIVEVVVVVEKFKYFRRGRIVRSWRGRVTINAVIALIRETMSWRRVFQGNS